MKYSINGCEIIKLFSEKEIDKIQREFKEFVLSIVGKDSREYRQNDFENIIGANHDYLVKERCRYWKLSEEWR